MQRLGTARAEEFRLTLSALHRRREVLVQTQKQLVVLMHGWLGKPQPHGNAIAMLVPCRLSCLLVM